MAEAIEFHQTKGDKEFYEIKTRQIKIAKECLEKLFSMIQFGEEHKFKLSDGREAFFKVFYNPEIGNAGQICAGIDAKLPDGHLEFYIELSGFGGEPVKDMVFRRHGYISEEESDGED